MKTRLKAVECKRCCKVVTSSTTYCQSYGSTEVGGDVDFGWLTVFLNKRRKVELKRGLFLRE